MKHSMVAAAAASALAVPASLLTAIPASATPDGSTVVISEVYGAGANAGASYDQDFVELFNPTTAAVDLAGTSIQYRSATGISDPTGVADLTGTIAAGGHFLVGLAKGGTGADLPVAPDVQATGINISASKGTVFLADRTGALSAPPTGSLTGDPQVLDLVGFGATNTFETAAAPAPSSTSSISRAAEGTDTDDNAADLSAGAPSPAAAGGGSEPPGEGGTATIEQIQGTGDSSPMSGMSVVTSGLVTASYRTGGFNGFYLQTPGTGGDIDLATHHASDAVFVYLGGARADSAPPVGSHVTVSGTVSEFRGLTELDADDVTTDPDAAPAVKPATVVWPRTDAERESLEGMLIDPQGDYTVSDNYATNQYAEIGLATGDHPLPTPTDVADPHDAAAIAAVETDNAARLITLDDGASTNFLTSGKDVPLPWLTQDHELRVGAPVRFTSPMVVDYRNNLWKLQPTGQLTAADAAPATFGHTRQDAPAPTGGNLHLASFNVLNYFPTTGADWVASGGTCTWYDDREGNHITVKNCTDAAGDDGPRGAADQANLERQQIKIVHAINHLGADIVSLEEIENSAKFAHSRDWAVAKLVDALNAEAGAHTWRYVPTPPTAGDQSDEDVIRTAFIYKPARVKAVGPSIIDDAPAFDVARDPLAQAFAPRRGGLDQRFAVIVNHFKSKGSGPDDGTGQGNSNPQRIAEADELTQFADRVQATYHTPRVFLSGDFNSYTQEDPMRHLYAAGYTDIGSTEAPGEYTYQFDGMVGSLDHVLANRAALGMVRGAHVWNINSVEPVALEYSRYNDNATDFYAPDPFRASDHDPLVVGIDSGSR
ncbi:ExeM/NucH family extracellular endonuclease [Nocardioides terrisoli]|uniref:ExeM/NucH family extracellular endonuclease n=1 Tax=Nocardioides terrisoli TaxID=3388267 RepID=UPI00287B6986|nr:ExeM/NucH family extracellular endonuclease [Nocardioides marmorisolisilvae]